MEKEVIYNENLHFEHQQWQSELAFMEDELKSFKNRLSELVTRWTKKEVIVQLEHFQNQFALHDDIIDKLQEDIEKHEMRIAGQTLTALEALDIAMTKKHLRFRDSMETQRQLFADLKKEFFRFLTNFM